MATKSNNDGYYPKVTGKRRKAAERLVDPEFDGNISALCNEIGVARSTFYRWMDDADFKGYLDYLITKYTDSELANVWRATIKSAVEGNPSSQKLFFELKGKYKQQVEVGGGVVFISGEDDIPE